MKRIDIVYGGARYSIANTELAALQGQIAEAVGSNRPLWLEVNEGEGSLRTALLLVTPGVSLVLISVEPREVPFPNTVAEADPADSDFE